MSERISNHITVKREALTNLTFWTGVIEGSGTGLGPLVVNDPPDLVRLREMFKRLREGLDHAEKHLSVLEA